MDKKALADKKRKIVIAAGGTGGHVFPAISLAHQLKQRGDSVLFIGGGLEHNPFFNKQSYSYREVACARFSLKTAVFPFRIAKGTWQSLRFIKGYCPDFLVGFGSYYTFPVLLAARLLCIPYVIHEQNSIPGKVNKFFSRSAHLTAIHFPSAAKKMKGRWQEVAMPLRPGFEKRWGKKSAKKSYGLDPEFPVLLVFGGSQGAEAINQLLYAAAPRLRPWQVLHFTGNAQWEEKMRRKYQESGVKACVRAFEPDMASAWTAAELAVSRAGAGSIAEQIALAVPGILIPYPYSADHHQEANADYLVEIGGAVKLDQAAATPDSLLEVIQLLCPKIDYMRKKLKKHKTEQRQLADCLDL